MLGFSNPDAGFQQFGCSVSAIWLLGLIIFDSDSVPWGCHWGAGWLGCSVGTSEPFGRGLDTVALGGPPVFTSELIGEDSLAGH